LTGNTNSIEYGITAATTEWNRKLERDLALGGGGGELDGVEEVGGGGEEDPASLRVNGGSDDRLFVELQTELLRGPRHKAQVPHLAAVERR
jgi:hypothetical protein